MTGRILANRLLEAEDDDLDIASEVRNLSTTIHPGVEIDVDGNRWSVYKLRGTRRDYIGSIYYDDLKDMPPEAATNWAGFHWITAPVGPRDQGSGFESFDDAVGSLIALEAKYKPRVAEGEDDPESVIGDFVKSGPLSKAAVLEDEFKKMLAPYYDQVTVYKHANLIMGNILDEYFKWAITCKRTTGPLPLLPKSQTWYTYGQFVDWRVEVKYWFDEIVKKHGATMRAFKIGGRIRSNPVFTFDTYVWKEKPKLSEADEEFTPDQMKDMVQGLEWNGDLTKALWQFHPYGCGYDVLGGDNESDRLGVAVWTYFPVDRRDAFAEEVKNFVVKWVTDRHLFPIHSIQMSKWESKDRTGFTVWINIPFDVNKI